jgi:GAF domain-containing protein
MLLDEEGDELTVQVATGAPGEAVVREHVPRPRHRRLGRRAQRARRRRRSEVGSGFYGGMDEKTGFETRSILAVPMHSHERTIGVLEVINKREGGFDESDLKLATALANHAAIAVENARLYARLADAVVTSRMSYRL